MNLAVLAASAMAILQCVQLLLGTLDVSSIPRLTQVYIILLSIFL